MTHAPTFEWLTGSAADNMIRIFKELEIEYGYNDSFVLCARLDFQQSEMVPVTYYHIEDNIYGITVKPQRTSTYFDMSPEALACDKGDGYTKEECMLLDRNPGADPFCNTLKDALEKAWHYEDIGYDDIHILERINNKYAVIAHG